MADRTGLVTFKGNPVTISGPGVKVGDKLPEFTLVANDLSSKKPADCAGKTVIISVVPSLDTGVCDKSTRKFNEEAAKLNDTLILTVSRDLPFAQKRWCGAAGVDKVSTLSDFRGGSFGKALGMEMLDGPLAGLLTRAVLVVDKNGVVQYQQIVPEITQEPDYGSALAAAQK